MPEYDQVIMGNLAEEVKAALLPILHFMADLWTCKVSGKKWLGIHLFYVDRQFALHQLLLAVSREVQLVSCRPLEIINRYRVISLSSQYRWHS